jgi:hypothetical protein
VSIKIASLFAELGVKDSLNPALKTAKGGMSDVKSTMKDVTLAAGILAGAYVGISKAIDATVGEFARYADQVRTVNQLTGQTSEDSSRLIQTLDDYKISIDNINAATKTFITNGKTMSVDTLATLSDQYNSLTTAQDKNKFMIDNFGKDYQKFLLIMEQGGKTIRDNAANVSSGLIFSDEDLKRARQYEVAIDNLGDSWNTLKYEIGGVIIQPVTFELQAWAGAAQEVFDAFDALPKLFRGDFKGALEDVKSLIIKDVMPPLETLLMMGQDLGLYHIDGLEEAVNGLTDLGTAAGDAVPPLDDVEQKLEDLGSQYSAISGYAQDLTNSMADLNTAKDEQTKAFAEFGVNSDEYKNATQAVKDLEAAQTRQTDMWVLDVITQQLSTDGLTSTDMAYLLQYQINTGIITTEAASRAQAMYDYALSLAAIPSDVSTTVTTNFVSTGAPAGPGPWHTPGMSDYHGGGYANGADFIVPPGYPNDSYAMRVQSGEHVQVTPASKTYNINITNPTPQAAEHSITRAMQRVNYLGGE